MRKQNNSLLVKGVLPLMALAVLPACVDDNYDLTDIDTTSRIIVNDLTVPVPLGEIKIDNLINLDDNENISKIFLDGQEIYAIEKGGDINTSDFRIPAIHVNAPNIPSINISLSLPADISSSISVPAFDVPIPENQNVEYSINLNNIDAALTNLSSAQTSSPISLDVTLSVPEQLMTGGNNISFKDLVMTLPWGLIADNYVNYNYTNGLCIINELPVGTDGKARFTIKASGIDMLSRGEIVNHSLSMSGNVGISSGNIHFDLANVSIPKDFNLKVDYTVSSFDITSFSGDIDYHMDNLNIAPISLGGLPDFLNNDQTSIRIANPKILVNITNPVVGYGLYGTGKIALNSRFNNGGSTVAKSDDFYLWYNRSSISFGQPENEYEFVSFPNLGDILTCSPADGLPSSINVNLEDLRFYGNAQNFPLGSNISGADGDYKFLAPLGFADGSQVVYETVEDGWGGEDLEDVNITHLRVHAKCETNIPVGIQLWVTPVDKDGNEISIKEPSPLQVTAMANGEEISIQLEGAGAPIRGFDGVKFRAVISQGQNFQGMPLGPDLFIKLTDVRANVDGYYETDF